MLSIGIDVGKVNSQVSIRGENGEELKNVRIPTAREALTELLKEFPRARILVESCTPVRWISKVLKELGHEVLIADPNYLPMYVNQANKRKKTDKNDARLLSAALLNGNWRAAHLRSEAEQVRKSRLDTRVRLVAS